MFCYFIQINWFPRYNCYRQTHAVAQHVYTKTTYFEEWDEIKFKHLHNIILTIG